MDANRIAARCGLTIFAVLAFSAAPALGQVKIKSIICARATWVPVREDGQWLIAALRVMPSEKDLVIREPGR